MMDTVVMRVFHSLSHMQKTGSIWKLLWSGGVQKKVKGPQQREPRPSTRGPFCGHLRGMFRGESLKG